MTFPLQKLCCSVGLTAAVIGLSTTTIATFLADRSVAAPAKSGWVKIKTEQDNKIWYVDTGSITGKGRFRYFWSYITGGAPYPDPEVSGQLVYSTAFYLSVDCQQKQFRLRYAQLFDQGSKLIKEFDYGTSRPLGGATPGSGEEASVNYVCSRRR